MVEWRVQRTKACHRSRFLFDPAGHCFSHRINDICYALTETNVTEDQCSSSYYSDGELIKLDGHMYAQQCRNVQCTYTSISSTETRRYSGSRGLDDGALFDVPRVRVIGLASTGTFPIHSRAVAYEAFNVRLC